MQIEILQVNGNNIALVISNKIVINNIQDALDLLADSSYQGAQKLIIKEENITADFFDLKTKIAGDILQKFSNYKVQLAIVGDFSKYNSKSLKDFIYESNKHKQINFVNSIEDAKEKLSS